MTLERDLKDLERHFNFFLYMHTVSPNDRRVEPWMSRFIELRNKSEEWNDEFFFCFF